MLFYSHCFQDVAHSNRIAWKVCVPACGTAAVGATNSSCVSRHDRGLPLVMIILVKSADADSAGTGGAAAAAAAAASSAGLYLLLELLAVYCSAV
jgi:hypothetical protein